MPCEHQSYTATSQGTMRCWEKAWNRFFPSAFREGKGLLTPWSQTDGSQNCETVLFCCLNSVALYYGSPMKWTHCFLERRQPVWWEVTTITWVETEPLQSDKHGATFRTKCRLYKCRKTLPFLCRLPTYALTQCLWGLGDLHQFHPSGPRAKWWLSPHPCWQTHCNTSSTPHVAYRLRTLIFEPQTCVDRESAEKQSECAHFTYRSRKDHLSFHAAMKSCLRCFWFWDLAVPSRRLFLSRGISVTSRWQPVMPITRHSLSLHTPPP